jgi:hypothetical protein
MERFSWIYDIILEQIATLKQAVFTVLRKIPFLSALTDGQLQWVFIGLMLAISMVVIVPLIKWSVKIAVGGLALAAILTVVTSFSFWSLLPLTGLAVSFVLFSHKFQVE